MFRRTLIICWVLVFGAIAIIGAFPKLAARVLQPPFPLVFILALILISGSYGLFSLYRAGIKRSRE